MVKRLVAALLIITMIGSINTSASACVEDVDLGREGCGDCVHVDTLDLEIPDGEKLGEVKDDGSFITEVIEGKEELGEIEQETRSSCSHPELRYVTTLFQKISYNKNTQTNVIKEDILTYQDALDVDGNLDPIKIGLTANTNIHYLEANVKSVGLKRNSDMEENND